MQVDSILNDKKYSVFVDGTEVNNYYLDYFHARLLADEYLEDGYENVIIVDRDKVV